MLRSMVSRVHLSVIVLGCAVLGASLLFWFQAFRAGEDEYTWVGVDSSGAPAVETAEIWQVSANCQRPFFVKAVLQSKARLKNHYDLAPEDVRAWQARPSLSESLRLPPDQKDLHGLVSGEQGGRRLNVAAEMERGAKLHAQYAEWYATASTLETQANQWEHRLNNVSDQKVILSEATRRSFKAYSDPELEPITAKSNYERHVLFLLGLGGFPSNEEQTLKATCVNITPVKKVLKNTSYFREIWRWPVDHIVLFSFGLELVVIGALFVPIVLWIGTGDSTPLKRHIRDTANLLAAKVLDFYRTKVLNFHRSKFAADVLPISRAMLIGILRISRAILIGTLRISRAMLIGLLRISRAILVGMRAYVKVLMKRYPARNQIRFG